MTTLSQRLLVPFNTKLPDNTYQPYGDIAKISTYPLESCNDMTQIENVIKFLRSGDVPDAISSILLDPKKKRPSILIQIQDNASIMQQISAGLYKVVYNLPQKMCRGKGDKFIYKRVVGETSSGVNIPPDRTSSGCSAYWENFQMLVGENNTVQKPYPRLQYFCTNMLIEAFGNIYTSDLLVKKYTPHLLYTPEQYLEYTIERNSTTGVKKRVFTSHCIQEKISGDIFGNFDLVRTSVNNTMGIYDSIPRADFLLSIQVQISYTLYILQKTLKFRHNDLWLRNLYFKMTNLSLPDLAGKIDINKRKYLTYNVSDTKFNIKNTGFRIIISDFDRCRFETNSVVLNNYDMYIKINDENDTINTLYGWESYDYIYQLIQWLFMLINGWNIDITNIKVQISTMYMMIIRVLTGFPDIYNDTVNLYTRLENIMNTSQPIEWFDIMGNLILPTEDVINNVFYNIFGITLTNYLKNNLGVGRNFNHFKPIAMLSYKFDFAKYMKWLYMLKFLIETKVGSIRFFSDNVPDNDTYIFSDKMIDHMYTIKNIKITDKYYRLKVSPLQSNIEPPKVTMKKISITVDSNTYIMVPDMSPHKSISIGHGIEVYEFTSSFPSLGYVIPENPKFSGFPGFLFDGWLGANIPISNLKQYITVVYIPKASFQKLKPSLYHYNVPNTIEEAEKNPKKSMAQIFGTIGYDQTGVIISGNYFNYKTWRTTNDGKYELNRDSSSNLPPGCVPDPNAGCVPPTCNRNIGYYKTIDMNNAEIDEPVPQPYEQMYGVIGIKTGNNGDIISAEITKDPDPSQNIVLSGAPVLIYNNWSFDDDIASGNNIEAIKRLSNAKFNTDIFGPCVQENTLGGFLNHGMSPNPRMGFGINSNGDILLVNIEGRGTRGNGVDFIQMARIMKSLGCKYAIALDGGKTADILYKPEKSIPSVLVNTNPVHKLEGIIDIYSGNLMPGLYPSTALMFKSK